MRVIKTLFIDGNPAETVMLEVDESHLNPEQLDRALDFFLQEADLLTGEEPPNDTQH